MGDISVVLCLFASAPLLIHLHNLYRIIKDHKDKAAQFSILRAKFRIAYIFELIMHMIAMLFTTFEGLVPVSIVFNIFAIVLFAFCVKLNYETMVKLDEIDTEND